MSVIDLSARRVLKSPHREGQARCLNCKHEWQAVAPAGTTQLECTACGTMQGVYLGLSATERPQWVCKCGEWLFCVDTEGIYCAHCGHRPVFP